MAQAQAQQGSPTETAMNTAIKILSAVNDETAKPYVEKALASLKIGIGMMKQKQPMSPGMNPPPQAGAGGAPPQVPTPPMPGQMPV